MKAWSYLAIAFAALCAPQGAMAKSTPLALDRLAFETVEGVAERSIVARDAAGRPLIVLLQLDRGDFLPPHGEEGGLRLLTVLSGHLSWGDGLKVDAAKERLFGPGTLLVLPAQGAAHWAAARQDAVLLQIVFVRDGVLAPEAAAQIE